MSQSPLSATVQTPWQQSNFNYLTAVLGNVGHQLNIKVAQLQNQLDQLLQPDLVNPAEIAARMESPPALETLCRCLALSEFERYVLLLCVGRVIQTRFPDLFAIIHQNPALNYPTFKLAYNSFQAPHHWSTITPQGALRRWQLIQESSGDDIFHARLQVDESILHYLLGEPYQDFQLTKVLSRATMVVPPLPLQASHQQIAQQVATFLTNAVDQPPIVQLCGTGVEQKWAIATAVSHQLQWPLYSLSVEHLPTEPHQLKALITRWQRLVKLTPSLLWLDAEPQVKREQAQQSAIAPFLQAVGTPLIVSTIQRIFIPRLSIIPFEVASLSYQEQLGLWETSLGRTSAHLNGHLSTLASQFNLSPATIQAAGLSVAGDADDPTLPDRLWDFCRLQARPQLESLAQRIDADATWDELVLPDREKQVLRDITAQLRQRAKVYQEWGFAAKTKRGLGLSALFAGASGTGKTMAAEVLAREFKLDLYRIDLSAVMSKYIGETEKNLRKIFDAAETGGAILLFDEADALFGKRSEVKDSHDRHANIEVSYLLQRMESYQGLAILTTNLKDSLDQAFLRRIRFIVTFPFPKAGDRSEIWQRIFPKQMPTQDLDFRKLGRLDVTGGNIRSIALNAAFIAADANEPVMMKHILRAAQAEYIKLNRALTSAEIKGWVEQ
ncbi:MAG: ATP-binding protein [Cyanobacteria bacterium]|nr:ATP-binding protein [Cyanobacteriota bacterium]MDA0865144.1 ATP-binding protein [Cyanobacteriota bacterium]